MKISRKKPKCSFCGKIKPDNRRREDPYAADVDNTSIIYVICDECTQNRAEEV